MLAAALGAAGFAASFFTAGTSLILLAVSAGIGAGGGVTVAGSSITSSVLTKLAETDANKHLERDNDALREILFLLESLNHVSKEELMEIKQRFKQQNIPSKCIILSTICESGKIGFQVGKDVLYQSITTAGKLTAAEAGRTVASFGDDLVEGILRAIGANIPRNVLNSVGGLISLVFLPVSVQGLIEAATVITRNKGTKTTELLHRIADALEREIPSVEEFDTLVDKYLNTIIDN